MSPAQVRQGLNWKPWFQGTLPSTQREIFYAGSQPGTFSPSSRIFSHPNVLPVLGACQSPPAPHPTLITHWMPYGSLYNVLHEGTSE